jgi:hypothetical protein
MTYSIQFVFDYEQKSDWHNKHQPHRVSEELNIAPNSV